jgi:signal peptidase I
MKQSIHVVIILSAFLLSCSAPTKDTQIFHGTSMEPNIHDGDRLSFVRFDRGAKFEVKRGDVIAFRYPEDPSKFYIKRLIALPGETIEIRDGTVFINGSRLNEPYVDAKRNQYHEPKPPLLVTERHYYVLGDNRDASGDSRSWGLVPEENIFAKMIAQ